MASDTAGAAAKLKAVLAHSHEDPEFKKLVAAKDEVLRRYQAVFAPEAIPSLSEADFRSFLYFENNRHWTGLHRQGVHATADMGRLREALALLLDETRPIEERLDRILPWNASPMVPKLGRATVTAILHVVAPDKYGVWNGTSEGAMQKVGAWPAFPWGAPFGKRYVAVNHVLLSLAMELGVDLWTLDSLWWMVLKYGVASPPADPPTEGDLLFHLEKYLHEFLFDNWDKTTLGKEWALVEEDGEVVGFKYNTGEVGEIDLLARHRKEPRLLVIELKRNQTSDDTVGQVLRYMGWVKENRAGSGEEVEGLIIAHQADKRLEYALKCTKGIRLKLYTVDFRLFEPEAAS